MTNLDTLNLYNTSATDDSLAALLPLSNLRTLSLNDCDKITDKAADTLAKMTSLESLWLGGTKSATRESHGSQP